MKMFIGVLCGLVAVIFLFLLRKYNKLRKKRCRIPNPPGHWLLGNLTLNNLNSGELFDQLRNFARDYGPIYRISIPFLDIVNFFHPADLEIILSQKKHMKKSLLYQFLEGWLGKGLLTSTGSKWQFRRKLLTQAFHFNILQKFVRVFNEETTHLVKRIEEINLTGQSQAGISVLPLITHLTLQSVTETSLGVSNIEKETLKAYRENIYKMGDFLIDRLRKPWRLFNFIYHFTEASKQEQLTINKLHQFTYQVIKEREEVLQSDKTQSVMTSTYSGRKIYKMLDLLLHEKLQFGSIDYEGIREEVDTFMFEGHDTTSAALVFLLHNLASNLAIQEKVRQEIKTVERIPTFQTLQNLPYTDRVIKESLRLYPSVPFISRIASEDFITHTGYSISKGTVLYMHIFDLHRNPEIYPDPLTFDPDRFLPEKVKERHPFAYLPFSAGPRNCIGQKFAMLELKAVLWGLLHKFRLTLDPSTTQINFQVDLILRTQGEIKINFQPLE
uniref:CYP4BG1 n=1 Tax=Ips paraconfusus TaxID=89938 RepID=A1BPS3_9CUCU|nr:CYP4BG1 [Ips paraconfusus]